MLLVLSVQSAQLPAVSDMKTVDLVGGTSWYSTVGIDVSEGI